jgi:hypothetical protein
MGYPQLCGHTTDFFEKPLERRSIKTDQGLSFNLGLQMVRGQQVQRPLEKSKGES